MMYACFSVLAFCELIELLILQVTPDPNTPAGYAVRTDLLAIIDVFEVNRKECARILLEYPKWVVPGTFKPKPGGPSPEEEPVVLHDWQLESTLLEVRDIYISLSFPDN